MANRITYGRLVLRVILLAVTSLLMSYLFFNTELYPLASLISLIFVIQVIALIHSLSRTNKKVAYFFDAVRNDDSTLYFPENVTDNTERYLNSSMNKVNKLIQKAKKEQFSQEQYYSYVLEEATTGLITYNKQGHILLSNTAAKKLLGFQHFTHLDQLIKINEKVHQSFKSIKPGESKVVKFLNEKETVQLSLKSTSISINGQELNLVAIQNIRDELEDQEIESWIRLIRVLTHEIMNSVAPITSIAGTLSEIYKDHERMGEKLLNQETLQKTVNGLNIIGQRGDGLINFVDSYRKLTKMPLPRKKLFKVRDFFESIRMLVSQEANFKEVEFIIEIEDDSLNLLADQEQLTQVMINLVKNAVESVKGKNDARVILQASFDNDRTIIQVIDNGIGIEEELLEQIFIPFFTTKEEGTGIGLSLSHHIIRMHGGKLQVESNSQQTTFKLIL